MLITINILTDKYPLETSWSLINDCTGAEQTTSPQYTNKTMVYIDTYCLPEARYTFVISDTYGDGICCDYGQGSYSVTYDGNAVTSGGQFESSKTSDLFGSCGQEPTLRPTLQPSAFPSKIPTPSPTTSPSIPLPTFNPTRPPTAPPTVALITATYDVGLGAPKCSAVGVSCTSGALIDGRGYGNAVSETNYPNTLDGCADGNDGTYHGDESIDMITVSAVDGGLLQAGDMAEIEAKVWAYNDGDGDTADFYYTADVNSNPNWILIDSIKPLGGGIRALTVRYTLPASAVQAARVNFRWKGKQGGTSDGSGSCSGGNYDDADDLVFSVVTGG